MRQIMFGLIIGVVLATAASVGAQYYDVMGLSGASVRVTGTVVERGVEDLQVHYNCQQFPPNSNGWDSVAGGHGLVANTLITENGPGGPWSICTGFVTVNRPFPPTSP